MNDDALSKVDWPHAPPHRLGGSGTFMVTCGTYEKVHHFRAAGRLRFLHDLLLGVMAEYGWQLEAWAVFSNHYHFVARSPVQQSNADSLSKMLGKLHTLSATYVNELDATPERKVWHNFYDTLLDVHSSYLARLNYVNQNAVKHGLVKVAKDYPWCSAGWLERVTSPAMLKTLARFKSDRVNVLDGFTPEMELGAND